MYRLGVDLGGTNIAVGLVVKKEGELVHKDSVKTPKGKPSEILETIFKLCEKILNDKNLTQNDVKYIGMGVPGTCDYERGIIGFAPNIKFNNVNVREGMAKFTSIPIQIDNDANCAALGESIQGAAAQYNNSVTVTLGTGVGVGVVLNGKLVRGNVEAGHHIINFNGTLCGCGRKGCLEAYCSATALIRDAKIAVEKNPDSKILSIATTADLIEAKTVFDAAERGDETAKALLKDYIFYLSVGITNFVTTYPIQAVIFGGGVAYQGEKLLKPLREAMTSLSYPGAEQVDLKIAKLGNDAGIIGAAMMD